MGGWYKLISKYRRTLAVLLLIVMGISLTAPFIEYTLGVTVNDDMVIVEDEELGVEEGEIVTEQEEAEEVLKELQREDEYLKSIEDKNIKEIRANTGNIMMMRSMAIQSTKNYEIATDTDFSGTANGNFRYIGNKEYVEVPHTIKGVNIVSYSNLFNGSNVKGVKSTNKNVTFMTQMFYNLKSETIDVSQLDTTNVTGMASMFGGGQGIEASKIREITGLGNFDTSKVTSMASMFFGSSAEVLDVSNFDTSNVLSTARMFGDVREDYIDVSNFNTSKVQDMSHMFSGTLATKIDVSGFDTTQVVDMNNMFYNANSTDIDVSKFNTSKVVDMSTMFYNSESTEIDVSNFDTTNVINMNNMFAGTKGQIKGVERFNTGNVTNMGSMFSGALTTNLDVSNFNTSQVDNMSSMFQKSSAEHLDLSGFDTINVTTMSYMFDYSKATYVDVTGLDTTKVQDMRGMFRGSYASALDLGSFNTEEVINMSEMFKDSKSTSLNVTSFSTAKVIDMGTMFMGTNAEEIDLSSFNTMRITDMSDMFNGSKAKVIDVTSFDTSYVTNMGRMFQDTEATTVDLSSFDTRSINNTGDMFKGSKVTTGIARSKGDADKLNSSGGKPTPLTFTPKFIMLTDKDFIGTVNGSFKYVGNDDYVEVPHKIRGVNVTSYKDMFTNTKVKGVISTNDKVADMSNMFKGNTSEELDVGTIDTSGVTTMSGMFENTQTEILDLRNFITVNVKSMGNMFKDSKVHVVDLGSFDLGNVTSIENMFQNTTATLGYARTQEDLVKLKSSSNKPTYLKFTVWSIVTEQTPKEWTNGSVDIGINAVSDEYGVDFVEMVNEPGRNLLPNSTLTKKGANEYLNYTNLSPVFDQWGTGTYTFSFDLKSEVAGSINAYTTDGASSARKYTFGSKSFQTTTSWKRYYMTVTVALQTGSASTANLSFYGIYGSGRIPSVRNVKIEKGGVLTPWTPAPEDKETSEDAYSVYDNGTYIFRAIYKNGDTRTVAHTVTNIDKELPTVEVTKSTTGWTSQDVTLTVNAKDTLSGVKSIVMPDGKVINASTEDYVVKTNGGYKFKVIDNAGNETTYTEKVTNIDRNVPSVSVNLDNTQWTKGDVKVTVSAEESVSGLVDIKLTSGQQLVEPALTSNKKDYTIKLNGLYTFTATYGNGLTSEVSVNVTNIDREAPEITVKGNPIEYTEDEEITLEVSVEDTQSGLLRLTLPDGTTTTTRTTSLKVTENGTYTFKAIDNLGNKTTHTVVVDKIMIPYRFYIYDSNGKPIQGAGFELLRDGNVHDASESDVNGLVDFGKVPPTGKYTVRQVKAPDGHVVNPGEQEVEVGDTTDPIEYISYPRGDVLPATGTSGLITILLITTGLATAIIYIRNRRGKLRG